MFIGSENNCQVLNKTGTVYILKKKRKEKIVIFSFLRFVLLLYY